MGRIHAIKMSLLPKILYSFRVLPILVPPHVVFYNLEFICGRARLRLNRSLLYTSKVRGGLGVPNISHYYKAAQIAPIVQLHVGNLAPVWTLIDVLDSTCVPSLVPKPYSGPHPLSLGFH